MKSAKWSILCLLLPVVAWAQPSFGPSYGPLGFHGNVLPKPNTDSIHFTIPPYQSWSNQSSRHQLYAFDEFQPGHVQYADGFVPQTDIKLNFNRFFETVDMWTEDGSWAPLKTTYDIKFVWIGDHKFQHDRRHGYIEIVDQGTVALGVQYFIYGLLEDSNGFKTPIMGLENRDATVRGTRYYWASERYFFIGPNDEILRASPQALPRLLPSLSKQINAYAEREAINFRNKEDLLKILEYCNQESARLP